MIIEVCYIQITDIFCMRFLLAIQLSIFSLVKMTSHNVSSNFVEANEYSRCGFVNYGVRLKYGCPR